MENEKLFELMEKMYADLKGSIDGLNGNVESLKSGQDKLWKEVKNNTDEIADLKKTALNIEQEHGKKLDALFDGYKQNSEQLTRIEKEVSKHEEVILRRVK